MPPWGRDGDDLLLLYTGGTTGMPKGVMWRQDDLFSVLGPAGGTPLRSRTRTWPGPRGVHRRRGFAGLPACPLMHGTGAVLGADRC